MGADIGLYFTDFFNGNAPADDYYIIFGLIGGLLLICWTACCIYFCIDFGSPDVSTMFERLNKRCEARPAEEALVDPRRPSPGCAAQRCARSKYLLASRANLPPLSLAALLLLAYHFSSLPDAPRRRPAPTLQSGRARKKKSRGMRGASLMSQSDASGSSYMEDEALLSADQPINDSDLLRTFK